jgi:hypothetical protein
MRQDNSNDIRTPPLNFSESVSSSAAAANPGKKPENNVRRNISNLSSQDTTTGMV